MRKYEVNGLRLFLGQRKINWQQNGAKSNHLNILSLIKT